VKLSELAVRNPQMTLVALVLMVALGVSAFLSIPRSEDPSFPIPIFLVVAVLPGASPQDLEQLVAEPLEDALRELDDLKDVVTTARAGVAIIRVEFRAGVDADTKYADVLREVERQRGELPADLARLQVERMRTSNVSVVQVALVSPTASYAVLEREANRFERRLRGVAGVRRADTWAVPEREVRVTLDLERLSVFGLTSDRVLGALQNDDVSMPAGNVDIGRRTFGVKTTGRYRTLEEVRGAVVGGADGAVVHLADVADVSWGHAEETHLGRFRGERAVFVTAQMTDGQSVFDVDARLGAALDELEPGLPAGVTLERAFHQSKNVAARLDRLYEDFALAILLVLITLLPLGFRASLVVMVSIPLSLALGLAALEWLGFSLNQLSIVGFVIALGLLVDDSIVVVENITRFLREGRSRVDAAILASKQIGVAVLGCTATLIFAFVPLLFLPGSSGDFIRSLPVAVIVTVAASLLVALTVTPFLASRLLPRTEHEHGNVVLRSMHWLIEKSYTRVLERALAFPKLTMLLSAGLVVAAVALVPTVGFSLFPKAGTPQFLVKVELPEGAGLAETDRAVRFAERVIGGFPEVRWWFANVGRGNPSVYYNLVPRPESERYGELFVELRSFDPKSSPALLERMRRQLSTYPGARLELLEFENGPPVEAPVVIRVHGEDLAELSRLSAQVAAVLERTPGTRDVDDPVRLAHTDLDVQVDRERAGMLGVPVSSVARTVRLALAGLEVGTLRARTGEDYAIRVVAPHGLDAPAPGAEGALLGAAVDGRATLAVLDRVHVPSLLGRPVPLAQIADLPFASSAPLVQRRNGERIVTVTAQVVAGQNTERVTAAVERQLGTIALPPGYRLVVAGERESRAESFGGLGSAILVAVFGILGILVLEFRTFKSTLIVATVIPLGFVGGIVFLWLTKNTLSFTAVIGFIALVGIEIKNSILLVDYTNQLRAEGMELDLAIRRAGEVRFLPIVLTTMTALGGLVPLAWQGSALYAPLALVIVGGLISSTILARLVTPVAYKLLAPAVERAPT
jgi:multidrug efflux pump subunit AcrB